MFYAYKHVRFTIYRAINLKTTIAFCDALHHLSCENIDIYTVFNFITCNNYVNYNELCIAKAKTHAKYSAKSI